MREIEPKYEDRLNLIRKMHDEEILQIRKINDAKEHELEQMAIQFQTEKVRLFKQAKSEAKEEEKKKRAKF